MVDIKLTGRVARLLTWTTLVLSRQSMQLTRKTPFCRDKTVLSQIQKYLGCTVILASFREQERSGTCPCASKIRPKELISFEIFSYLRETNAKSSLSLLYKRTSSLSSPHENHIPDIFGVFVSLERKSTQSSLTAHPEVPSPSRIHGMLARLHPLFHAVRRDWRSSIKIRWAREKKVL